MRVNPLRKILPERVNVLRRNLAFRLTFWYAVILIGLFTAAALFFFPYAARNLDYRTDAELTNQIWELAALFNTDGFPTLSREFERQAHTLGATYICLSVLDAQGKVLLTSDASAWTSLSVDHTQLRRALAKAEPALSTVTPPGLAHRVRVAYLRVARDKALRVAILRHRDENFMIGLQRGLIITMAATLAVVVLVGWVMLRNVTGRVVAVTDTALTISSGSLHRRVPVSKRGDEIDHMARAFNGMLDRIESLVRGLQETTDNVAHDLKIPLARIRVVAESLSADPDEKPEFREFAGTIVEEADRLLEMINTTHEIKAIEAGIAVWDFARLDLDQLVREAVELFEPVAEDKGLILQAMQIFPVAIRGDLRRLQRVLANLIDNAIKYTPPGGRIEVALCRQGACVGIRITDTGIGIAPEAIDRIFERFYRADQSRSASGLGLGLSLADSIIRAHGGSIHVQSAPDRGSTFMVLLPSPSYNSE